MSLVLPMLLVPVLSPTRQPGRPARRRLSPVWLASAQSVSRRREAFDSTSPSNSFCRVATIAAGVVVSRGSPGVASLSVGSLRSRRVTVSPMPRNQAVSPAGPPCSASSRLAAVLSLIVIVASHSAATGRPAAPSCFSTTGDQLTRSSGVQVSRRSSRSSPASTAASTCAASSSLKVLHIAKRSSPRCPSVRPVPVSSANTPRRPPWRRSSVSRSSGASPASAGRRAQARPVASRGRDSRADCSRARRLGISDDPL